MASDLVSIVIVCYNNWPDLELAIESSLHQSYQPTEVIVVDNDSSDATPSEVPKRYGNRLRYLRQANRGDSGGYNAGVRVAQGEFVQFLDGDDFLAPNKIEKQVAILRDQPRLDVVYGDMRQFQSYGGAAYWEDWETGEYEDMLQTFISSDGGPAYHSYLYRRRVLEGLGNWDETLYTSDLDYWLRAAWAGYRFRYCPGSWCFYRRRPGQMSANSLAMMRGVEAVWAKALGYITSEPYRSMVLNKLALTRFRLAMMDRELTLRQAFEKLALARAADPSIVNLLAYTVGAVLIVLPGSGIFFRARWMKPVRHCVSRIIGTYPD
ncbi:MAG: glycosyltransferase [Acidobacteria bacterium]|nr:glycosyltransferase [Acidobacteriota bacterium]